MATQITNYKCPACTGPLHFVGDSGRLECDYCGSSFTVEEIEALYAQKDAQAAEVFKNEEEQARRDGQEVEDTSPEIKKTGGSWDDSTINSDWGEDGDNMRAFVCPSCGAELLCETTTAATSCPYCGNPSIVPGQLDGSLKPDLIIPFKLDKAAAESALRQHYSKRLFLPKTFSSENQIKKIQGVYVPFWLFNATVDADCCFDASNSISSREGDYIVTRTMHYTVYRSGRISFENIPTDASKKMPNDLMDSIEPFDQSGLKPFSTAYLPGYLANKFDVTVEDSSERADKRCAQSASDVVREDVVGYQTVVPRHQNIDVSRGKVSYALLPVWMIKTKWQGKDYLFAMNGQTGKFVGNLPVSKGRFWGLCGGLTAVLGAAFYLLGIGGAIAGLFGL